MDRQGLEKKIGNIISRRVKEKQSATVPWIIHELFMGLKLPKFEPDDRADEVRITLYEGYRQIVGVVVRASGRKDKSIVIDPEWVLPGFERLQRAYSIDRPVAALDDEGRPALDDEGRPIFIPTPTIVPIQRMTENEARGKLSELIKLRGGLDTHILEWKKYIVSRWPDATRKEA